MFLKGKAASKARRKGIFINIMDNLENADFKPSLGERQGMF